ncbi:MAG: hypothetical protein MRY64_05790 [Hyphomonadaceae bacterium]|nr:hypothetical protein [Hyphomonadaceae bacterium]
MRKRKGVIMLARGLAMAVFAALIVPGAIADHSENDPSDILGVWNFQTQPYRDGACRMTGTMHLSHDEEDGVYACELTALEMCSIWGQSIVRQNCSARRFGDQVSVRSRISEVLERKGDIEGMSFNYVPDNFALTVKSSMRMYGSLVSAVNAPVEFHRSAEGVS